MLRMWLEDFPGWCQQDDKAGESGQPFLALNYGVEVVQVAASGSAASMHRKRWSLCYRDIGNGLIQSVTIKIIA